MSDGQVEEPGGDLDRGRREVDLSMAELWWAYFALGGNATPTEVRAMVTGLRRPERLDHDILAQAINDRFLDLGLDHPVAYAPELPEQGGRA